MTEAIPFTRSQRSSIRTTGLLMLPIGLITLWSGVDSLSTSLPIVRLVPAWPFVVQALSGAVEVVLGLALLIGGAVFVRAAGAGTIGALIAGLRALCVLFAIKAALLLLVCAGFLFVMFGAPMLR